MPIGTKSDLKIYDPQLRGGYVETLTQNLNAFNGASNGAIRLVSNRKPGQFESESFFPMIAGLVRQRDPTSTAAIADKKITQSEIFSVKIDRGIGPVAMTLDSFRKAGFSSPTEDVMKFTAGAMAAKAVVADYLNAAIRSVVGALDQGTAAKYAVPNTSNSGMINTLALTAALAKFGDAANSLGIFVMHSGAYFQLVDNQIVEKIVGITDYNISTASPVTLNRPVLVTDSDALLIKDGGNNVIGYRTLLLAPGAVEIEDTESEFMTFQMITGLDNLAYRMQGEYAYNLGVKGFTWDKVNGGASPSDTALVTAGNWDVALADVKNRAGVIITSLSAPYTP